MIKVLTEGEDDALPVTALCAGTPIPDDLQLIKSTKDTHPGFELKPVAPCTVPAFSKKLNRFLKTLRVVNTNEVWCKSV